MRLAIAVLACSLLAGCAAAATTSGSPDGYPALTTTPPATATDADRRATAGADARHHLAEFRPPAGAHRLPGAPTGAESITANLGYSGRTTADATSWWEVTSRKTPADVVAAITVPPGARAGDTSSSD